MNRRLMKKTILASLLLGLVLLVQNASAMPTPYLLPESSYASMMSNWQGIAEYDEFIGGVRLKGRIDYAVYDTTMMLEGSEEKALADALNLAGQYIYAYQVINDYEDSDKSVAYFEIFGSGGPLDLYEDSIGSHDDGSSGKAHTDDDLTDGGLRVVWDFAGGLLYSGDHSWFLVFASDSGPVHGDYEVKAAKSTVPIPDTIPEPATVALLGLGVTLLRFGRKRRKAG